MKCGEVDARGVRIDTVRESSNPQSLAHQTFEIQWLEHKEKEERLFEAKERLRTKD